jgi:excisionase family DNA binding protein
MVTVGEVAARPRGCEMTTTRGAVPRLALTPEEAAGSLGVSRDFFDQHVKPDLRVIRRGRLVLVPVRELERWTEENAVRVLGS